jgi:ubiquinol-cytochrome c reductase cytochrome c subunit
VIGPRRARLLLIAGTLVAGFSLRTAGWDDDDEERAYERELAVRTWKANCLICHGEEHTTTQRLTPKQWRAEVEKMMGWGSPVPADEVERLIAYLAAEHPATAARGAPPFLEPAAALALEEFARAEPAPGLPAAASERGAKSYAQQCANCHGTDARGGDLGPNLVERPILIQPRAFSRVITNGLRRMPGYTGVLDDVQIAEIRAWLTTRTSRL